MRKLSIVYLALYIATTNCVFAYIPGKKITEGANVLTCPQTIECDGLICTPSASNMDGYFSQAEYIDLLASISEKNQKKNYTITREFLTAQSSFHSNTGFSRCIYRGGSYISLPVKREMGIEADLIAPTRWGINGDGNAECASLDPALCPFKVKSALVIHNANITNGIVASINGNTIGNVNVTGYTDIIFEDALAGCSNVKLCSIDITNNKNIKFGSVIVDMDANMNIVRIEQSRPELVQLKQVNKMVDISYISRK